MDEVIENFSTVEYLNLIDSIIDQALAGLESRSLAGIFQSWQRCSSTAIAIRRSLTPYD